MTRISKLYVVSSMLAALALSANGAVAKGGNHGGGSSAGNTVATGTPKTSKQTAKSGTGAGKAKFNEFTIKKTTDSASPNLFKSTAKETHYKQGTIVMRKDGGGPTVGTRSDTSYDKSGKGGSGNQPSESTGLNGKIEYQYK
jgi:hypothetical protein